MTKPQECVPNKGDWVILKDDVILFCDPSSKIIMKKAKQLDDDEIVISKEPSSNHCFY